jgi:hypothetical protein
MEHTLSFEVSRGGCNYCRVLVVLVVGRQMRSETCTHALHDSLCVMPLTSLPLSLFPSLSPAHTPLTLCPIHSLSHTGAGTPISPCRRGQ